jgi:hypothetical protein
MEMGDPCDRFYRDDDSFLHHDVSAKTLVNPPPKANPMVNIITSAAR